MAVGLALAALNSTDAPRLLAFGVPLVIYAALRTIRPLRYLSGENTGLVMVLAEVALSLGVVVATGYWTSPYAFCLASAILAAGFARGFGFAIRTACAAIAAVAIPYHVTIVGARSLTSVQWGGELLLIALVAGYARRLFGEAEQQSALARQANDLLSQLNAVAQTLPGSLDLTETVAATILQLRELFSFDVIVILIGQDAGSDWTVVAAEGHPLPATFSTRQLPEPIRLALTTGRPTRSDGGQGFDSASTEGIAIPLLARDVLIGLLAIEQHEGGRLGEREIQLAESIAGQAALALDNARSFSRLRIVGADEERTRIARDLHDRVGQSLAFVSFELDRISHRAAGGPVEDDLLRLREEVRRVVTEVRDTLYDLRMDVSERQDLVSTLADFVDRVSERTSIDIGFNFVADRRLPLRQEREIWRIAQEAVTNALRHADATSIQVHWRCDSSSAVLLVDDDGRGLPTDPELAGPDGRYGIVGMRERAAAIGGRLDLGISPGGGVQVRCAIRQ